MNGMYEELIEKLRKNNRMSGWTHIDRLMDDAIKAIEALQQENEQLQEFANAKADGRMVVLPCKVGDMVYVIYGKNKILETKVDLRFWNDDDGWILRTKEGCFYEKYIGKTVFLSREEAEKALEGSK